MGDIANAFLIFFALFVGTFLCGYLPSCINARESVMNKITIFGGGCIIGLALMHILPESCTIMISTQNEIDKLNGIVKTDEDLVSHETVFVIGAGIMIGFSLMLIIDEVTKIIEAYQVI